LPPLSPDAELALFRALQEGLANIARHAQARRVDVSIAAMGSTVTLLVVDDGVGFSAGAANNGAMGLTGMRERVAALGGTLAIDSTAGRGTRLRITLDVEAPK